MVKDKARFTASNDSISTLHTDQCIIAKFVLNAFDYAFQMLKVGADSIADGPNGPQAVPIVLDKVAKWLFNDGKRDDWKSEAKMRMYNVGYGQQVTQAISYDKKTRMDPADFIFYCSYKNFEYYADNFIVEKDAQFY